MGVLYSIQLAERLIELGWKAKRHSSHRKGALRWLNAGPMNEIMGADAGHNETLLATMMKQESVGGMAFYAGYPAENHSVGIKQRLLIKYLKNPGVTFRRSTSSRCRHDSDH